MRTLVTLAAAAVLLFPAAVPPAFGKEKPLPPAFGKELVPDEQSQERNEPKAAEMEEQESSHKHPVSRPSHRGASGQKLHIELDGGEDGGGDDDGGDGGDDL